MAAFPSRNLLRAGGPASERVSTVELFFDLVLVFAITQLSHGLVEHLDWAGAAQTGILLLAVWWFWNFTAWATNWLDPERGPVRAMLIGLMFVGLVMSTSIPEAFGERSLVFAIAYVVMQVGRNLFVVVALRGPNRPVSTSILRSTLWFVLSAPFWIAGGIDSGHGLLWWGIAVVIEYAAPLLGFWMPGLGSSPGTTYKVSGHHMAERASLFVIIALGESILVTGTGFSAAGFDGARISAFVAAFAGTILMWLLYFNHTAEKGTLYISRAVENGSVARVSYSYLHVLVVAGIVVVAVGDELVLAHPDGPLPLSTAIVVVGGMALYLLGNLLFTRSIGYPWLSSRGVAILVLGGLCAVVANFASQWLTPLTVAWATNAVLLAVVLSDERDYRSRARLRDDPAAPIVES